MSNVIELGCVTTLPIPPDRVLTAAGGKMESALVIGFSAGEFYFASSEPCNREILWLLELARKRLMDIE